MTDEHLQRGEHLPAGEDADPDRQFTIAEVASAFGVEPGRVERAVAGEFAAGTDLDSQAAQHLAEVILGDQPLAERQAALMRLGAYTPRSDVETGLGEKNPDDESDRLVRNADRPDGERGG